jgi:hypothetical protein
VGARAEDRRDGPTGLHQKREPALRFQNAELDLTDVGDAAFPEFDQQVADRKPFEFKRAVDELSVPDRLW